MGRGRTVCEREGEREGERKAIRSVRGNAGDGERVAVVLGTYFEEKGDGAFGPLDGVGVVGG